jgi:hypothetical protein
MFNNTDYNFIRDFIINHLSESKIPIDEIITQNVLFSKKITEFNSIYIYSFRHKYYMKVVTFRKSEEETHEFTDMEELTYRLVELQMMRKAYRDNKLYHKEAFLQYMKEVDDSYYHRALNEWNKTHL